MANEQTEKLFSEILDRRILKKAVYSKASDKAVTKLVISPFRRADGSIMLSAESFCGDNKAIRKNLPCDPAELVRPALEGFRQVNIFTTAGDLELRRSKSGSLHISGKLDPDAGEAEVASHDERKNYIIDPSRDAGFLRELGLADRSGRIHDKKQAKFRQINRFLEIIRDVEGVLPEPTPAPSTAPDETPVPNFKVTIFSSRRSVMAPGETVTLTCKLEGFEGYETLLQWECDKGNGYENVEGANGDSYSFEASVETLSYGWRLTVYYRPAVTE